MGALWSKEGNGEGILLCGGVSWKDVVDEESREALSIEAKNDELLLHFPNRLFSNQKNYIAGGLIGAKISMYSKKGQKGVNQDSMLAWEGFAHNQDAIFCGIFDGHGKYGHVVSMRVRDSFPLLLSSFWEVSRSRIIDEPQSKSKLCSSGGGDDDDDDNDNDNDNDEGEQLWKEENLEEDSHNGDATKDNSEKCCMQGFALFSALKTSFYQASKAMDQHLRMHPLVNCFHSGTTSVTLVKQGEHLVIANIGDSRAIVATRRADNSVVAVPLTIDHKPGLPKEEERIKKCNGRVFALDDEARVKRVWLPHRDSPGLAMSRAFGDFCLKNYGLISVPEVTCKHLTNKDLFVVLASDGVWDVLSNQEVVSIIASAYSRDIAAKTVVDIVTQRWRRNFPDSPMDDCTVVCLYLDV